MSKVWFITGTSKGFGRVWAEAALGRGDRVAATARDTSTLQPLVDAHGDAVLPLQLDVTGKAQVDAAVGQAHAHFGRIDIVVNNAGYGHFGMIEEITEAEARAQIETNVFGALWVTQAALPFMREQGSGHVLQVSSIGGVNAFPGLGLYHASKWALEGFSQSLDQEVSRFGIKTTIIEPGGFATDWSGPSSVHSERLPAYEQAWTELEESRRTRWADPGDPAATGPAILDLVDAQDPPRRVFLGKHGFDMLKAEYASRIETWERWQDLAVRAHG